MTITLGKDQDSNLDCQSKGSVKGELKRNWTREDEDGGGFRQPKLKLIPPLNFPFEKTLGRAKQKGDHLLSVSITQNTTTLPRYHGKSRETANSVVISRKNIPAENRVMLHFL